MSVTSAYLTERLFIIWDMKRAGLLQADIATKLGVSRQAVNQALDDASDRINRALTEQANISKIEIDNIDIDNGMLVGWSREFSVKAVITLSKKDGLQVWYEHEADCAHCNSYASCRAYLFRAAKDRHVKLTSEQKKLVPSKLAQVLYGLDKP